LNALDLLIEAVKRKASDLFIIAGKPIAFKINGNFIYLGEQALTPNDTRELIKGIYALTDGRDASILSESGDDDFSVTIAGVSRFRVNTYVQRGSPAAVLRIITFDLPNFRDIGIPDIVMELADKKKGLILVTGTAGSGKSTTLACLIDRINKTQDCHVVTLEDPIEYLHQHQKGIISQREVETDTKNYIKALRASFRQAPDVVLLGEMRDHETISVAMTAAETGHLVLSTLHAVGAANTIDRVIDAFPPHQQSQVRIQLSMVLQAVVSQQLIHTVYGGIVPAFEIMFVNNAVRNMIRESKIHQIDSVIHSSAAEGMRTMDASLLELYKQGIISAKDAVIFSANPEVMSKKL